MQETGKWVVLAFGVGMAAATACGDDSAVVGASASTTTAGAGAAGEGGGIFSGAVQGSGGSGQGGEDACVQSDAEATIVNSPVDIIMVIDNSGSMGGEIEDVEEQLNTNFAAILDAAEPPIDYRVILVSEFGRSSQENICIAEPLGGIPNDPGNDGHCASDFDEPINTARFFHHSPASGINSHNALCRLGEQLTTADEFDLQPNGYVEVLRPEAFKFFVVVTDDRPDNSQGGCTFGVYDDQNDIEDARDMAEAWDADILAASPEHFGTAEARNYQFHSIVSLAPYDSPSPSGCTHQSNDPVVSCGDPHPPDEALAPLEEAECAGGAEASGLGYQALSVMTGGARYPTCGLDYTEMFQLMAQGVIDIASVPCEFLIPDPPEGEVIDLETIVVEYHSGATDETVLFTQVDGVGDCPDDAYYIDGDTIRLCEAACAVVQADDTADLAIKFGCDLGPSGMPK